MSKAAKSLLVIALAIAVAAGAGFFLTRRSAAESPAASSSAQAVAPATGGGHIRGPATAEITLVEFGDYQCPSCGAYYPMVEEVLHRFPQVRLEFHHYPIISLHPNAMMAAMSVEAADEQHHYWEMHDLLYQHQQDWSDLKNPEPQFIAYATQIGIDPNQFMQALRSPATEQRVLEDVKRADAAGVNSTPTFFIGADRKIPPMTLQEFSDWVESHLKQK